VPNRQFPVGAVRYLKDLGFRGNVMTHFEHGGLRLLVAVSEREGFERQPLRYRFPARRRDENFHFFEAPGLATDPGPVSRRPRVGARPCAHRGPHAGRGFGSWSTAMHRSAFTRARASNLPFRRFHSQFPNNLPLNSAGEQQVLAASQTCC